MTADIVRPVGTMKTTGIPADATPATATTATAAVGAMIMVPLVAIDTMVIATARETGMKTMIIGTAHPAMTVMTGEDAGVVTAEGGEVGVMLPQSTAHRLQKVLFLFPSASALPLVGTCTPLDMSDIQLCKPKQQVSPQLSSAYDIAIEYLYF